MGHKEYMLVGDVEVPYEHPPQDFLKSTFFYRFLCFFWWNMLPEANHKQYCQNSLFWYGGPEKNAEKWKMGISINFNHRK